MRDNQRDGHEELERAAHGNGFAVGARTAARRRVTQQVQLEAALMRYSAALARDRAAEARDRDADERDRIAAGHDAALETLGRTDPALATRLADAFTDLRRAAAEQRSAAAADRDLAAHDRRRAAADSEVLAHLVALSETDSLTGARMRGPGLADLELEIERARRSDGCLTAAYVDVVGLKRVNDTRGHAAGDALLIRVAGVMRQRLRAYDLIVRVGGDEFACALSGATVEEAGRRFRAIESTLDKLGDGISFGLAELRPRDTADTLLERADAQLTASRSR